MPYDCYLEQRIFLCGGAKQGSLHPYMVIRPYHAVLQWCEARQPSSGYDYMIMYYTHIWSYDPIMPCCNGAKQGSLAVGTITGQDYMGDWTGLEGRFP